jgi:ATP-dependent DNA ligase
MSQASGQPCTMHSKGHDVECFLYAFDLIELNGEDLRQRKSKLRKLLGRLKTGIVYNEHIEAEGATICRHASKIGRKKK